MLIAKSVELHRLVVQPKLGVAAGAPEEVVAELEARLGSSFPRAYREYLLWMGADNDGLLRGTECFIDDVESNEQGLADLLEENDLPALGQRPIVFFLHQGYIACWFNQGDREEDPSVFTFSETDKSGGIRSLGTFSRWLYVELSALAEAL